MIHLHKTCNTKLNEYVRYCLSLKIFCLNQDTLSRSLFICLLKLEVKLTGHDQQLKSIGVVNNLLIRHTAEQVMAVLSQSVQSCCLDINRIHHGWSVEIGKSQPEGLSILVGNEACRVSHWNDGPEG